MIRLALVLLFAVQQVGTVRTAVISGMVVDETGGPVGRAWLGLTSADLPGARTAISGDDGRFTFTDLPAGRFRLYGSKAAHIETEFGQRTRDDLATTIRLTAGERLTNLRLRLTRTSSVRGRFVDTSGKPVSLQSWEDSPMSPEILRRGENGTPDTRLYLSLDGRGGFKVENLAAGTYLIRASPRSPSLDVVLAEGQQLSDVLLTLAREDATAVTSQIEGDVFGADGTPVKGVELRLVSLESDSPTDLYLKGSPRTDDQGHFEIGEVPVGRYMLIAKHAVFSRPPADRTFRSSWASSEVVAAEKVKAYTRLTLQPGVTVRGQIRFEATSLQPPPISRVGISLRPQDGRAAVSATVPGNVPSQVEADGSFTVWSVPPGRYTVDVRAYNGMQNLMEGWSLESAILNGVDVLDVPFTVTEQDVTGITVRLTDQSGTLEGTTKNAAGEAKFDSTVIVFPVDSALWNRRARKIRAVRPDTSGAFLISDLPGGDYFVAAIAEIAPQAWFDPKVLSGLAGSATRVSVTSGAPLRVSLSVR